MPTLKAMRELRAGGKTVLPGQTFEATEKDARVLVAVRRAVLHAQEDEPPPARAVRGRRAMLPADPEPVQQQAAAVESNPAEAVVDTGRYARRDMRATDEIGQG